MDGLYVRFYLSDATLNAAPLPLTFYDLDGNARPLDEAAEEVFYLHSVGWSMGAVTGTLFDDRNDDDSAQAAETVWHFPTSDVDNIAFGRPVPMKRPKIITSGDAACVFVGHGFIRGK